MGPCELMDNCSFVAYMADTFPRTCDHLKVLYCDGNQEKCIRWRAYQKYGMDDIPLGIFPCDSDEGEDYLRSRP
jgi:hypothetical protein